MKYYELTKEGRISFLHALKKEFKIALESNKQEPFRGYFSDPDTYIRKAAYQTVGKLYFEIPPLESSILQMLNNFLSGESEYIRQTAVYTMGEIGQRDFLAIEGMFRAALDDHHKFVRGAIKGSLKRMGERNPNDTFQFIQKYIQHPDPEIRKEMIHGIELRGRLHPEEVLPMLQTVQNDPDKSVQSMICHVLTQISYKQGCLEKVLYALKSWTNTVLVGKTLKKMIEVHRRYANFAAHSPESAEQLISTVFRKKY